MNNTFFDGLDELYHRAKFGEDRRTRTGCRCENVVFVTIFCLSRSEAGAPCVRRVHSSNKHCVAVYQGRNSPLKLERYSVFFCTAVLDIMLL